LSGVGRLAGKVLELGNQITTVEQARNKGTKASTPKDKPLAAHPEGGKAASRTRRVMGDYSGGIDESTARRWAEAGEGWIPNSRGGKILFADHMVGKGRRKESVGRKVVWFQD